MLPTVKDAVQIVLTLDPKTRDDDFLLVSSVYETFYGVDPKAPFAEVMMNHKRYQVPSFESIRRWRQKFQQTMPILYGASGDARRIRKQEEEFYHKEFGNG